MAIYREIGTEEDIGGRVLHDPKFRQLWPVFAWPFNVCER